MESRRRKKQISAACHYAYTRLALNYYMYYEVILEGDLLSSRLERLSKRYHGLLKDFLEGSLELEELNGLRDDTASAMEANTAYTDVFQAYEYVLNRLEGRFEPQLMGNRNVRPDEEEWTAEIMAYIMDTDEPMVVNERVQSVVGQLPIRLLSFFSSASTTSAVSSLVQKMPVRSGFSASRVFTLAETDSSPSS